MTNWPSPVIDWTQTDPDGQWRKPRRWCWPGPLTQAQWLAQERRTDPDPAQADSYWRTDIDGGQYWRTQADWMTVAHWAQWPSQWQWQLVIEQLSQWTFQLVDGQLDRPRRRQLTQLLWTKKTQMTQTINWRKRTVTQLNPDVAQWTDEGWQWPSEIIDPDEPDPGQAHWTGNIIMWWQTQLVKAIIDQWQTRQTVDGWRTANWGQLLWTDGPIGLLDGRWRALKGPIEPRPRLTPDPGPVTQPSWRPVMTDSESGPDPDWRSPWPGRTTQWQ